MIKTLDRIINSIGKKSFITYYFEYKQCTDKEELANLLLKSNKNAKSKNAQITRINSALKIFENNLQIHALKIIINANVTDDIIVKACDLLKFEISLKKFD